MLLSTASFAVMNVCIKKVSHIPALEVVFFRCGISALLCFWALRKDGIHWIGTNRKLLLLRGIFGTIALYTFFITLQNMPLGTAVTIQYLSPIFTTIIGIFILNEKIKPIQWLFFALSFAGVLVLKGFDARVQIIFLILGIVSALASGFAYNFVRSLKGKENPIVVVLHFQLIGTLMGACSLPFSWETPIGIDWTYILLIGVTTQFGQLNLTHALQKEKVADITILNYLGVIYALVFGVLFFGEHYTLLSLSGIILVLAGVGMNFVYMRKNKKKGLPEAELSGIEE